MHGGWAAYEDVGTCSVGCGSNGVIEQWRNCSNPTPQHGGDDCVGKSSRFTSCTGLASCSGMEDGLRSLMRSVCLGRWKILMLTNLQGYSVQCVPDVILCVVFPLILPNNDKSINMTIMF